jgi:hypothetical protein
MCAILLPFIDSFQRSADSMLQKQKRREIFRGVFCLV